MRSIILLTGAAGAGKDTAAAALAFAGYKQYSFAAALKEEVENFVALGFQEAIYFLPEAFVVELQNLRVEIKSTGAQILAPTKTPAVRRLLQLWGTEFRRDLFGADYWVARLQKQILETPEDQMIVISDARFRNEFVAFLGNPIFVIDRPGLISSTHISEQYWQKLWHHGGLKSLNGWRITNHNPVQFLQDLKTALYLSEATIIRTDQKWLEALPD